MFEYPHTESLAKIYRAAIAEIQKFFSRGLFLLAYVVGLYMHLLFVDTVIISVMMVE